MRALRGWLLAALVVGAVAGCGNESAARRTEEAYNASNQERMIAAVPPPLLHTSQERKNLVRRYQTFDRDSKISYIYLLLPTGRVSNFYTVKGKVSSVNSLLTAPDAVIYGEHGDGVVAAPQPDGSYGSNGQAIFFYTTESVYVEWNGLYLLCDQPLKLTERPLLVKVGG